MAGNPASRAARDVATEAGRGGIFRLVGEIISELRKVTWPSRQETTRLTILVIVVSAAIGALLGLIDIGFSRMFSLIAGSGS